MYHWKMYRWKIYRWKMYRWKMYRWKMVEDHKFLFKREKYIRLRRKLSISLENR